jgi:hypothetical protein
MLVSLLPRWMETDIESESEIRVDRPGGCAFTSQTNAAIAIRISSPEFLPREMARDTRSSAND